MRPVITVIINQSQFSIVNNNNALNQEHDIFMNAYDGKPSNRWTEMWYFNKVSFRDCAC